MGGLLEPLEIEATTFERDLIVTSARRREAGAKLAQARRLRSELQRRETDIRALVERCLATVDPTPHYAGPRSRPSVLSRTLDASSPTWSAGSVAGP